MNQEKFHNALALVLGYERIVNDKRYNIIVNDKTDNPRVIVKDAERRELISFMAEEAEEIKQSHHEKNNDLGAEKGINIILDAVHQAYIEATMISFKIMIK